MPPPSQPPVIDPPSPPPSDPAPKPAPLRQVVAILLSLYLGLFLADALVSLADDSLNLLIGSHPLTAVRGLVCLFAMVVALVIYLLMGITPMIPKRWFLPITLFNPGAMLVVIPLAIYFYGRLERVAWIISFCEVGLALAIFWWAQGGLRLRWLLVPQTRLNPRGFSWLNLAAFVLVNLFVVLPAVVVYLVVCAGLAVGHFSEGFLALRPNGLTVQARKYVRPDGKTVHLVPMAHVGEAEFYHQLSHSFPTNSVVLMEGVTDNSNLLTNKITYKRMARSVGLAEQHEEFNPVEVEIVMADVDLSVFTTNTIGLLNLAMLFHSKGVNAETVLMMLRFTPPPHFEEQLWDDLLRKRNHHLLQELQSRLEDSNTLIVPWGVAHMPGIAEGIKAAGFRLKETQDYTVIRFRFPGSKAQNSRKVPNTQKPG
jgi:hypothetical protein